MMGIRLTSYAVSGCRNYSTGRLAERSIGSLKIKKSRLEVRTERVKWTDEQKLILQQANSGLSMFITGSAGTGKTLLLREIIKILKKLYGRFNVALTASTGAAACALKGQTLHSFASIGRGAGRCERLLELVIGNRKAVQAWSKIEALVIDEISMVDAILFDNLDYIARNVRGCNEPWGGIQLIVCGDFLQLPPVIDPARLCGREFAFEADCWDESFDRQVELTKVFRQSDPRLVKMLQGIRKGETDEEDLGFLEQSCCATEPDSSVVRLFPRIQDVEKVNEERMQELGGQMVTYEAYDRGKELWIKRLKQVQAPERLVLCKGARVMLIKNLNPKRNLVNGATGVVSAFVESYGDIAFLHSGNLAPVVKFDSGLEMTMEPEEWQVMEGERVVARRFQVPLILAWALSIHKCQGMTLDSLHTNLSRAFGCGMVYVALSRVRSLEGLHLSGFSPAKIKANPKVLEFYRRFGHGGEEKGEEHSRTQRESNGGIPDDSDQTSPEKPKHKFCLKKSILTLERAYG